MALRTSLCKAAGLTRSLISSQSRQSVRLMVSVTSDLQSPKNDAPKDTLTHTGQKFEESDYRMVRFIDREKQVNEKFAINLIDEVPPEEQKKRVVWCDGGGGPTGHPRVYINLDQPGNHSCGYCGLRFYKKDHHH